MAAKVLLRGAAVLGLCALWWACAVPATAATVSAAVTAKYLYYWNHDANFGIAQCAFLPSSLQPACDTAAEVQKADPATSTESVADRERYLALFQDDAAFPASDCPRLPAKYVAQCLSVTGATPTAQCSGASGTVCDLAGSVSPAEQSAYAVLDAYPGQAVTFQADPTLGVAAQACPLTYAGPTLLFSDDPERVPGPGVLYQDTVSGNIRVYMYHVNASSQPLHFGVLLTAPGPGSVIIDLMRSGEGGPSTNDIATGKQAVHQWLQSSADTTFTLNGGTSAFLDPGFAALAVPPGQVINGIYDFNASAPVEVSVVAQPVAATSLQGLSVLPDTQHSPLGTPMRGTFSGADPTCSVTTTLPWSGKVVLRFGADVQNYLHGTSAVDGGVATVDYGNFGVLYAVRLALTSPAGAIWNTYSLLLHPHDNIYAGGASVSDGGDPGIVPLPYNRPYVRGVTQAVVLDRFNLAPLVPTTTAVEWMTAASSSLPVDLVVYPLY